MRRRYTTTIACASLALLVAGTVSAATITWGPAVGLTSAGTEVSTSGTLVQALNFGRGTDDSAFDTEINGVNFTGIVNGNTSNLWGNPSSGNFSANTQNVGGSYSGLGTYSDLLSTWLFSTNVARNTVTLSGLTIGQEYLVQLFMADDRSGRENNYPIVDVGKGNQFDGPTFGSNNGDGFVINGTFTADGATQTFTSNNYTPNQSGFQLNAYQIRAVPEPATIGLLGAAGAGLMLALRRGRGAFRRRS